jgi:integrase
MGSIRKRGKSWFAEVRIKNHPEERASFDTKSQALAWVATVEAKLRTGPRSTIASSDKTLFDAMERYKREVLPAMRSGQKEVIRLERIARELDFIGKRLRDIDKHDIARWRDERLLVVLPSSVNRDMNALSSIFNACVRRWDWIAHNPVRDTVRPAATRPRDRRISPAEIAAMSDALGLKPRDTPPGSQSQRLALAFLLALETGMRCGEMTSLTSDRVFLRDAYVHLDQTKNGSARNVPLSSRAREILNQVMAVTEGLPTVFEVRNPDALWRNARDRRAAKALPSVSTLHFHDSRHEAITQLARKLDVLDLARMIGHRDVKSLMIYYNATASEIAKRLG